MYAVRHTTWIAQWDHSEPTDIYVIYENIDNIIMILHTLLRKGHTIDEK